MLFKKSSIYFRSASWGTRQIRTSRRMYTTAWKAVSGIHDINIPHNIRLSKYQGIQVSWYPGIPGTGIQISSFPGTQSVKLSRYLGYQGNSHSLTHYFTSHCISEACFCITRSTGLVLLEIGYWDISYLKLLIFTQILCRYDAKALLTVFFSVIWGGFQIGQAAPYIGKSIHRKAIYFFFYESTTFGQSGKSKY